MFFSSPTSSDAQNFLDYLNSLKEWFDENRLSVNETSFFTEVTFQFLLN